MNKITQSVFKSWTVIILVLVTIAALAGSLTPPAGPSDPTSAMFYLEDIYNRLDSGAAGARRTGDFSEPVKQRGAKCRHLYRHILLANSQRLVIK